MKRLGHTMVASLAFDTSPVQTGMESLPKHPNFKLPRAESARAQSFISVGRCPQ